jgi:hypothetical protein
MQYVVESKELQEMIMIENDAFQQLQQFVQHIKSILRDFQGDNRKYFKEDILENIILKYDANYMDFIVSFVIQKLSLPFGIAIYEINTDATTNSLIWKNIEETEQKRGKVKRL